MNQMPQVKMQGVFRAHGNTTTTVAAFPRGDHPDLCRQPEIQHLGFRTDPDTFTAMGTGGGIVTHP